MAIQLKRTFTTTITVHCDVCGVGQEIVTEKEELRINQALERVGWKYDYEYGQDVCPQCQKEVG